MHQPLWAKSLFALDVFRGDLRLQDPRAECPLRGSGPGQVHWGGGHPSQGQAGLRAAERAHLHHPSLRLRRGAWWRQHEEIPQVSRPLDLRSCSRTGFVWFYLVSSLERFTEIWRFISGAFTDQWFLSEKCLTARQVKYVFFASFQSVN